MKEPKRIPLTDSPRHKEVTKIPLRSQYPEPMEDDVYIKKYDEDNSKDNSQSIQPLDSESFD